MKLKKRSPIPLDDRGLVLVLGLIIVSILMMIGTTAVLTSTTDLRISGNQRTASQVFNIAEAGSEAARERLRERLASGDTLTVLLGASRGPNGILTNSVDFNNYYFRLAFASDDIPLVPGTNFDTGTYRVFLSNDPAEGVTNPTDANGAVTLTSIATGPANAWAAVQVTVRRLVPADLPGAITLPGPNVSYEGGNSNSQLITGMTHPAIAVGNSQALSSVNSGINRPNLYQGQNCPAPCVRMVTMPYPWNDLPAIRDLVGAIRSVAHYTSTGAPGFDWGTEDDPRIVVIDGDVDIGGGIHGHGIIVVTGELKLHGNFSYTGMILAVGEGKVKRSGGGKGEIRGGILAANIAGPDKRLGTADDTWGIPKFETSGGGNSIIRFDGDALANHTNNLPLVRTSWRRSGF